MRFVRFHPLRQVSFQIELDCQDLSQVHIMASKSMVDVEMRSSCRQRIYDLGQCLKVRIYPHARLTLESTALCSKPHPGLMWELDCRGPRSHTHARVPLKQVLKTDWGSRGSHASD